MLFRSLARRALDATQGRLEAVLDAHRARKRSWRLLSVGDYDVDADGPVELLPRPEAAVRFPASSVDLGTPSTRSLASSADLFRPSTRPLATQVRAITERIATDLASAANFACQRQRKRHAYARLGDVYCRVVAGGHIDAADAAVVALLRGAAAKAYGARAAQRRDPGVVSLRVERQGALVEIDVALRDVRGLADDAAAYRALLATAEEVEAPAPAHALFSPVLSPSPAAPEAPVPANAPAPAEEEEDLDVLEAVSILVEKGKRSRRVLGPDHPLTVEVLGQLEQALSPTSPFSPLSAAPAPAPPLTVDDV